MFDSWVGKICWRTDRLCTPAFLGFPCGSAGKESTNNAEDLDSIPGLGRSPGEGKGSVQFSSVSQLCPTLCDPVNRSMPGLPVHHQLPEFTQTHVHWVGDAIQPSHPLSSPSPPAPNPSQHQGLFQWVNSSHEVAKGHLLLSTKLSNLLLSCVQLFVNSPG